MKNLIFTNYQGSFTKEYKTDLVTNGHVLTVHDIKITGTPTESDTEKAGLVYNRLPYSIEEFKAKAVSGNFTLIEQDFGANTSTTHNSATNISITNSSLAAGTNGVAEVTVLTVPSTAAAAQGDFVVLYNKVGKSFAVWLDKDAAGTIPTGVIFKGTDVQIKVSIVTGGSAIANGALVKAACEASAGWAGFATITNNGDATLTITRSQKGICTDSVRKTASESGNGAFSFTKTDGSGDYSVQMVSAGGNTPKSWSLDSTSDPLQAGLTISTTGLISGVPTATGEAALVIKVTDILGQSITKALTLTVS